MYKCKIPNTFYSAGDPVYPVGFRGNYYFAVKGNRIGRFRVDGLTVTSYMEFFYAL